METKKISIDFCAFNDVLLLPMPVVGRYRFFDAEITACALLRLELKRYAVL